MLHEAVATLHGCAQLIGTPPLGAGVQWDAVRRRCQIDGSHQRKILQKFRVGGSNQVMRRGSESKFWVPRGYKAIPRTTQVILKTKIQGSGASSRLGMSG